MNKKKAPPSPRLLRLEAEIKAERDPLKAACLKAERAGFLGRQGFFDEAREALDVLQEEFGKRPDARLSIWMQMAEGWIAYFRDQIAAARDHWRRASALATAASFDDLSALSAAWLAHLAYTRDRFGEMERYLRIGIGLARANDHLTQTRLSLVMALGLHFSGHFSSASRWYIKARMHAVTMNDEAAIGAVTYNVNARRATLLLISSVLKIEPDDDSRLAKIGIESSFGFEKLLGISIFSEWAYIAQAMVCSASGDFSRAVRLYDEHMELAVDQGLLHQKASFVADMAWCSIKLGQIERAKCLATEAADLVGPEMCVEDRLLAVGRLFQVYEVIGDTVSANRFHEERVNSLAELQMVQKSVFEFLSRMV